jgi:large subunit ribosomal protein L4e
MTNKLTIYGTDGKAGAQTNLPPQFAEPVRADLIKRAVLSIQSKARQSYGAAPLAGRRHSVDVSRRRRDYRGSYGKGISRVPRKILSRRGGQMSWEGAFAPGTKGGRRAHPPKSEKDWTRKINTKENRKAIRSAIAATLDPALVKARGHLAPITYPFAVADGIEHLQKTKDLRATLFALGFEQELSRAANVQKRSGIATLRGRTRKVRKSILIVASSSDAPVILAAENILGVEACGVDELNAEILAPGAHVGRLTIFTAGALKQLEEKKLFA